MQEQTEKTQAYLASAANWACPKCQASYEEITVSQDYVIRDFSHIEIDEKGEASLYFCDRDDNGYVQATWLSCNLCGWDCEIDNDKLS